MITCMRVSHEQLLFTGHQLFCSKQITNKSIEKESILKNIY